MSGRFSANASLAMWRSSTGIPKKGNSVDIRVRFAQRGRRARSSSAASHLLHASCENGCLLFSEVLPFVSAPLVGVVDSIPIGGGVVNMSTTRSSQHGSAGELAQKVFQPADGGPTRGWFQKKKKKKKEKKKKNLVCGDAHTHLAREVSTTISL
jgi:hypothetical protein